MVLEVPTPNLLDNIPFDKGDGVGVRVIQFPDFGVDEGLNDEGSDLVFGILDHIQILTDILMRVHRKV
jgi:hypothetical protein